MLEGVHPTLVEICHEAVQILDFKVIDGVRTAEEQAINIARGVSWTKNSKHLLQPDGHSHAVDLAPWTISGVHWQDVEMFCVLAGVMRAVAFRLGVHLRWGGDFNMNDQTTDEKKRDYGHFELPDTAAPPRATPV
jgi:peptidoglycan L-alanyl-D-glutamate endopeptidase CwlK